LLHCGGSDLPDAQSLGAAMTSIIMGVKPPPWIIVEHVSDLT